MTATVLILLSAIVHAIVNILTKRAEDKYAIRLLMGGFAATLVFPALFFVPLPQGDVIYFLIASGMIHAVYELLLVKAYENGAFSAVYPIARSTGPLFTALGAALFASEDIGWIKGAGILLVCAGVIAIGISHRHAKGAHLGFAYALATGLTIGVYTVVDASGVRAAEDPLTYIVWFWIAHGLSVLVTAPSLRGRAILREARREWRLGLLLGVLAIVSYCAALMAFRLGATAPLAALRETSVLFGTALAVIFLGETMTARRWFAAAIIVAGAVLAQI
ncbi:MAG: hypothetical protein RJB62_1981 [Pseudomonadota bacterium]